MSRKGNFRATALALLAGLIFSLSPSLTAAADFTVPTLPHAFYGSVLINGSPAPAGTKVEAKGVGVETTSLNPILTSVPGQYGAPGPSGVKLVVQGDATLVDGTEITFYVNDVSTEQTIEWQNGEITQFDLSLTVPTEIAFSAGWNTFSVPISLDASAHTWDEFIADNDLTIIMIYGYDAGGDAWVPVNGDDVIEPLWGFYINVAEAGVAHFVPNTEPTERPVRDLIAGVHLVGIAPELLGDESLTTALEGIYQPGGLTGYTLVVSPNINPDAWAYERDAATPRMMSSGRAYWLVMGNPGQYEGSSTTPFP